MSSRVSANQNNLNRHYDDGNSYATSRSQRSSYSPVHKIDKDDVSDGYSSKNNNTKYNRGHEKYAVHNDDDDDDDASANGLHQRLNDRKAENNARTGNNNTTNISDSFYNNNNDSGAYSDIDLDGVEDQEERRRTHRLQHDHQQLNQPQITNHDRRRNPCFAACCPTWNDIKSYCYNCTVPKGEYRGVCSCPHGRCYGIMGILTAQGGLMMNLYVIGTCRFNRIKIINPVTGEPIPGSERMYGFDARETNYGQQPDYRQCTYYPSDEKDEIWDSWMGAAKLFSYLSAILGVFGFVILFSICCMAYSKPMFERWLFWGYITAAIAVTFSFLVFGSEFCQINECKVADGCGWAISCFFFHLMAANSVKNFPEPRPPQPPKSENDNGEDGNRHAPSIDEVYEELYYDSESDKYPPMLPDGRKRGVIYNDDGQPEFDAGEDYFDDMGRYTGEPDKLYNSDHERQKRNDVDDEDENGSDYTDASYDSNDESAYEPENEDYETWRKRQGERKARRDAKSDDEYIVPQDREFPFDDETNGNLGVGYEHIKNERDGEAFNGNNMGGKKILYAPPRPNIRSNKDDGDSGPVMA